MRLLLTNDDGINAEGIKILADTLSEVHEVWITAPLTNQSGTSNSIRMFQKLELQQLNEKSFALDGTPTDCVIAAILGDFISFDSESKKNPQIKFDAVISGINQGANLGTDVIYSGTCGASRQAVIYGIPGIALSVSSSIPNAGILGQGNLNYKPLALFVLNNLELLLSLRKKNQFININVPSLEKGEFSGLAFTSLSERDYGDVIELSKELSKDGEKLYSNCKGGKLTTAGAVGNDSEMVEKGYISVSMINVYPEVSNPAEDELKKFKL